MNERLKDMIFTLLFVFIGVEKVFSKNCHYWDDRLQQWQREGCKVDNSTMTSSCICNPPSWFKSSYFISPNNLDVSWKEILRLQNLEEYPIVLITFCVMFGFYLIMLVIAVIKDKKEERENGIGEPTILKSQSTLTGTLYHIALYSGHRVGSGTTATPSLIISGKDSSTQILLLKVDGRRRSFERASIETFIFKTDADIHDILYVTIWHDNKGKDPSWFLSRLVVTNLDTQKHYVFLCNDWFALDQSDGCIMRTLPVASEKVIHLFENIFLTRTAREFIDCHLWYRIMWKPPRSNFTRAQRLSSLFCLLMTTMLTNAMFHRIAGETIAGDEIDLNGMKLSWTSIMIGIQSSLIITPINLLIVILFRRARPNQVKKTLTKRELENKRSSDCEIDSLDGEESGMIGYEQFKDVSIADISAGIAGSSPPLLFFKVAVLFVLF